MPADIDRLDKLLNFRAILCHGQNGRLRILDEYARIAIDVEFDDKRILYNGLVSKIDNILFDQSTSRYEPKIRLSIDVVMEALPLDGLCKSLFALSEFLRPNATPQITFHFNHSLLNWSGV